jgi:hypothetical protein
MPLVYVCFMYDCFYTDVYTIIKCHSTYYTTVYMYCTVGCCLRLPLVNGFFVWSPADFFCVPHNSNCIKQYLRIMLTLRTQELNMEGQKSV